MLSNSSVQFNYQYNQANQHRLLRNRGPLYAPQFLWYRSALFTTKTAALRSAAVGSVMFSQRFESMPRIILISVLMVMAGINVVLDFLRHAAFSDIHMNVVIAALLAGFASAFPAGVAFLISAKARFKLAGLNIYRVASDFVLGLGLLAWFYLLFIRERPEYYEGASHMYVATWPILLGVIAIVLYLICLLAQGTHWAIKHNKVL